MAYLHRKLGEREGSEVLDVKREGKKEEKRLRVCFLQAGISSFKSASEKKKTLEKGYEKER